MIKLTTILQEIQVKSNLNLDFKNMRIVGVEYLGGNLTIDYLFNNDNNDEGHIESIVDFGSYYGNYYSGDFPGNDKSELIGKLILFPKKYFTMYNIISSDVSDRVKKAWEEIYYKKGYKIV